MSIRTIIAMSPSGLPYFSGNYICGMGQKCDLLGKDKVVESNLPIVSGFFTAIMNMAKVSGGEIQQISFENFQYLAKTKEDVIMIFAIDIGDKIEDYENRVQLGLDLFIENFGEEIKNWTGNVTIFDIFQSILEKENFFDGEPLFRKNCIECKVDQDCTFRMVTGIQGINFKDKLAKHPHLNPIKKMLLVMREMFLYRKQHKRFLDFQEEYQRQKQNNSRFQLIEMLKTDK